MATQRRLHAIVRGHVQGVGFRYFVLDEARARGLTGWVRNREDGRSVEVVAEGSEEGLRRLEEALHRGPRLALVEAVETEWADATGEFTAFELRW